MKRYLVIPFAAAILVSGAVYSQNDSVAVKVSKEKVKISGKFYYIHTVKPGETLYSIARAYQIAQAAIIESNPELYKGVKAGNSLKIPVVQDLKNPNPNKDTYHIVKKGETLYAISRAYNVSVDVLSKLNMLENTSVKENQSLYIPNSKNVKLDERTSSMLQENVKPEAKEVKGKGKAAHEVQPKESVYSISRKYNITVKELTDANPGLEADGPKVGQTLVIPATSKVVEKQDEKIDKPISAIKEPKSFKHDPSKPFNVVLMLPMSIANGGDTLGKNSVRRQEDMLQYYQGTLLALDSLKNRGVSVNLTVVDTKNDQDKEALNKALKNPALKSADLIIGPVYRPAVLAVAPFAEKYSIPMVSPLSIIDEDVVQNPYLIQVATDNEVIVKKTVEYAKRNDGRTVLVVPADGSDAKMVKEFKTLLKDKLPELSYRQGGYAQNQREALKSKLVSGKKNRFVVLSNNEVFVLDFLQNLSIAAKGYEVEVLGTSKWQKFTSIDMAYMHDCNVEIFLANHVDYAESGAKSFVRNFRNFYKTEPNNYAFRGFDVAYYFIDVMKSYGTDFIGALPSIIKPNIQTPFHFVKAAEKGGYINKDAVLIKHTENFRVVKVK